MTLDKTFPPQIEAIEKLLLKAVRTAPWSTFTTRQSCMLLLVYRGPATIAGLHLDMGVDKPALVRGADLLEGLGLLTRQDDPADGRSVKLIITAEGKRAVEKLAGL